MCDAANLQSGDLVLEIGPGTGILTREILARGAQVIAVEADARAIAALEAAFPAEIARGDLVVHHHDARTLDPAAFNLKKHGYKVVANIPYYLSGLLFRHLLDTDCQPNTLVFLIQKELAERIAREEKESLLSLSIKIFGDPSYICTVKRGHFTPPPKVDSAIVAVNHIGDAQPDAQLVQNFFTLIHLGFAQKRKQLLGNLSAHHDREQLLTIFSSLGLSATIRAEDIHLPLWIELTHALQSTSNTPDTPN